MSKENGGPAHPSSNGIRLGDMTSGGHTGMSLRDYFAAMAMQGLLAGQVRAPIDRRAEVAYEMADAMLKERAK